MTSLQLLAGAQRELVTPIAIRLRDDFSGDGVVGNVALLLDIKEGSGWCPLDRAPATTASGIYIYPNLERRAAPIGLPPRRYRVRIEAANYRPRYLRIDDAIEFNAFPGNDDVLPTTYAKTVRVEALLPSVNYPFPTHVPVLRGLVTDAGGNPVPNVVVHEGLRETVLTDERGQYALPLRWVPPAVPVPIDAEDLRTARTDTQLVMLPSSLGVSINFTIT
jgi:hypothetical protein